MESIAPTLPPANLEADEEWPRNRRVDPRTDRLYSLRNLLRIRAKKFNLPLVALGNSQDMLIAASEEGHEARSALMKASKHSGRFRSLRPNHADHTAHRFKVGGQELVLVVTGRPTGADGSSPGLLERVFLGSVADRIRCIFHEANADRPRGDEGPILHM